MPTLRVHLCLSCLLLSLCQSLCWYNCGCLAFLEKVPKLFPNFICYRNEKKRFIWCDFNLEGLFRHVIFVYTQNVPRSRSLLFQGLLQFVDTNRAVVLLGVFNGVSCPNDPSVPLLRHDSNADIFASITPEGHLVGIGSSCIVPCRFTHSDRSCDSPFDSVYVSPGLHYDVCQFSMRPLHVSDCRLVEGPSTEPALARRNLYYAAPCFEKNEEKTNCVQPNA